MLTTDKFITKAKLIHGDTYNYDKVNYLGCKAKVTITCKIHGDYIQKPKDHLSKCGCRKCANERVSTSKQYSSSLFIEKAKIIHSDKYTYCNTKYVSSLTPVVITCNIHGDFLQRPVDHLSGYGCKLCGNDTARLKLSSNIDKFISKSVAIHGDVYEYDCTVYKNTMSKVQIECKTHGIFEQSPHKHLIGQGCPQCSIAHGFDKNKPAILYYLKINGGQAYKIGITNKTVKERFSNSELQLIEIVKTWYYTNGHDAYDAEQKILKDYKEHKYLDNKLLKSGNSELFCIDVLIGTY